MSAGTKVTIAVVVLFAVLLAVYYGFGGSGGDTAPDETMPPSETAQFDAGSIDETLRAGATLDDAEPVAPGVLSTSIQQAVGGDQGILASDGASSPIPPREEPWILGPRPAYPVQAQETRGFGLPLDSTAPMFEDYVVQDGDSLWTIAQQRLGDANRWSTIASANPTVNPDRLRVGQTLRIPVGGIANLPPRLNLPASVPARASATPGQATHVVSSGDSLTSIAKLYFQDGTRWRSIYDANRDAIGGDPDRLKVGMSLNIPPA